MSNTIFEFLHGRFINDELCSALDDRWNPSNLI